jgi:hypothetical protein
MGIKISEMTLDSSIGGAELIPVSDAGSPKRVVVSDLKNYVVDQIEAIAAGTAVTGADGVFILQAGAMKPVDIDLVAQHAIDTIWGKSAISTADGADVLAAKDDGTTEKTMTLTTLKTYIAGAIYSSGLTLATLDAAVALAGADVLLVNQSGAPKRTTLTAVNDAIYAALKTYVTTTIGTNASPADSDVFYCIQGGVEKKVTLLTLKGVFGSVIAPATTTENKIPQWASGQKTLKDGLTLRTAVRADVTADDTSVPTEKAIRDLEKKVVYNQTDIGADLADADEMIVDDGGAGTTQRKSALTRMWTYIWSKVSGATAKTTPVDADSIGVVDSAASSVVKNVTLANLWTNLFLAKAKLVKLDELAAPTDVTTLNATGALHGLMSKTDKTKLDGIATGADVTATSIIDEDTMVSNLDTKVPTQQSTKAYVDTKFASAGVDIWTAGAKTTAVDADKAILSDSADSGASKTITFAYVWAYILSKIQACAGKITTLSDSDIVMIQDSAASFDYKEVTLANLWTNHILAKVGTTWFAGATVKPTPVDADQFAIMDSAASNAIKKTTITGWWTNYALPKVKAVKIDELAAGTDVTTLDATVSAHGLMPKLDKIKLDALVGDTDGTLVTGANADLVAAKMVYNKTCSDSDGDDVIDLHDATVVGRVLTIYLGTKSGSDNAVITPVTKLGYSTITLDAANEMATLQWQGSTVGWVILHTTGTVA